MKNKLKIADAQRKASELRQLVSNYEEDLEVLVEQIYKLTLEFNFLSDSIKSFKDAHKEACQEVLKLQGKSKRKTKSK